MSIQSNPERVKFPLAQSAFKSSHTFSLSSETKRKKETHFEYKMLIKNKRYATTMCASFLQVYLKNETIYRKILKIGKFFLDHLILFFVKVLKHFNIKLKVFFLQTFTRCAIAFTILFMHPFSIYFGPFLRNSFRTFFGENDEIRGRSSQSDISRRKVGRQI